MREDPELEALVRRYAPMVYRLAYARTGRRADAEDVMQETFLRLVRKRPRFQSEAHCQAWLLRVAVNCANSMCVKPWRRELPLEEAGIQAGPEPALTGVLEAVQALPSKYRIPIYLFYYEERSVAEIAAVLGKKEATVRTWLFRARARLRQQLEEEAYGTTGETDTAGPTPGVGRRTT